MREPIQLGAQLFLIDTYDLGLPGRTGCYVFVDESGLTLVETSASPSKPYIEAGLKALGYELEAIKRILLTHIHLDHAGGAGLFAKACPNADIVVHSRGARHLADPERLIQGAKAVYGEKFDALFNPILPVPKEQLLVLQDGDTLTIGKDRTLTFLDTPGHAKHHFAIYDPVTKGMFVGDTIGIRYQALEEMGVPLYLPSTSPNQFDPEAVMTSMARIQDFQPERLYFGHYSMSENVEEVYAQVTFYLEEFVTITESVFSSGGGHSELVQALNDMVWAKSEARKLPEGHPERDIIQLDLQVSALGLIDYFHKKKKLDN